jgi:hypothetical protein
LLFLLYFFPVSNSSSSSPLSFNFDVCSVCKQNYQNCLQTPVHMFLPVYMCTYTFMFYCGWLSLCVFQHVCMCHVFASLHVQVGNVSTCESRLAIMDIPYFSIPGTGSIAVCNGLLLCHYTFFHALCHVFLPAERILLVCNSHFPYLIYKHLSTIINIPSKFPWPFQDSCKCDCTTTFVSSMLTILILKYCTQCCLFTPSS